MSSPDLKKQVLVIVAMLIACIGHSFAEVNDGAAWTNISVGLQSLTLQTRAGLVSADNSFASALTNNPTNSTALTLKSVTGLAVLQENPEFIQLLTRIGVIQPQQSIYNFDYRTPTNQYGNAVISGTMSNVISYIDTTLRPQLSNSISQLSRVSTNVSFTLTGQQTGTLPVAVDYGDVQLALCALYLSEAASYMGDRYNFGILLNDVSKALSGELTIEEILVKYPLLLGLGSNTGGEQAKQAFINASAAFRRAVGFIPNQRVPKLGYPNVFSIDTNDPRAIEGFVSMARRFDVLASSFSTPQVFPADGTSPTLLDGKTINLANWLTTQTPPRSWIGTNSFWGDLYNPGTLTDPTFSGILPDMTQRLWSTYMQQQNRLHLIVEGALLETNGAYLRAPQPSWGPLITEGNTLASTYVTSTWGINGNPLGYGFLYDGSSYTAIEYPMAQFTSIWGMAGGKIWGAYIKGSISGSYIYSNGGFTDIRYPGARNTWIAWNNSVAGDKVTGGYWEGTSSNGTQKAFTYDGSTYTSISFPGASNTWINGKSGNLIWGSYSDSNWQQHGFLFDGTNYTSIDYPGATYTSIYGGVGGKVWGYYNRNDNNYSYGYFLYENGNYTEFKHPQAISNWGPNSTWIEWSDAANNKATGSYNDNTGTHGFIYDGSGFTTIDYPGAYFTTINGYFGNKYCGSFSANSGSGFFLYENGQFSTINIPGGNIFRGGRISAISGNNVIGTYWNGSEQKAFVFNGTTFATLSYPGANSTYLNEVGSKWVTGNYYSGNGFNGYGGGFAYPLPSLVPDPVSPPIAIGGNTGISSYTNTAPNGIVSSGPVSMNGNATIVYTTPNSTIQSTGAVSISGTNNLISLPGGYRNGTTNVLISGTSLTAYYASTIAVTGPAVGNGTISLGGSYTNAGSILTLQADSTSLYLTVIQNTSPLSQGLVAYYPLNGNAYDVLGVSPGVVSNVIWTNGVDAAGQTKTMAYFNGAASVTIQPTANLSMPSGAVTMSAWVKAESLSGISGSRYYNIVFAGGVVDGQNAPYQMAFNQEGLVMALSGTGDSGGSCFFGGKPDGFVTDQWVHITTTYDGTNAYGYINGVQYTNIGAPPGNWGAALKNNFAPQPLTAPMYLGARDVNWGSTDAWFQGLMQEVRIYNRALSASEVTQIYTQDSGGIQNGGYREIKYPGITLIGSNPIIIPQGKMVFDLTGDGPIHSSNGEYFFEPGASVSDPNAVWPMWMRIVTLPGLPDYSYGANTIFGVGHIDTTTLGSYTLTYTYTNSRLGISVPPVTRVVTVAADNNNLYVGSNTPNNSLVLGTGTSTYHNTFVGYQGGSSNNQLLIGGGSKQSLTNGLIAYYAFEGNGDDLSGNGRNLTLTNSSYTNGLVGDGLTVTTTQGGAFYTNGIATRSNNLTFSAWINPSQLAQNPKEWMYLISGSATDSVFLRLGVGSNYPSQYLTLNFGYGSPSDVGYFYSTPDVTTIQTNAWQHIVATASGSNYCLYVNGVLVGSITNAVPIPFDANNYVLGNSDINGNSYRVNGMMDEVRIYNRALSSNEVAQLYQDSASFGNGLIAHYPLQGNGNDLSGRSNHAVVNNATPTADRFGNPNGALFFNGTDAYLEAAHQEYLNTLPITISCWFSRHDTNSKGGLVSRYVNQSWNGYNLGYGDLSGTNSVVPFYARNYGNDISDGYDRTGENPLYYSKPITDTNWHLATMTVDTNGSVLYIDGVADTNHAWRGAPMVTTATTPLIVGGEFNPDGQSIGAWSLFHGSISDVRIYNRSLASNEVAGLYDQAAEGNRVTTDTFGSGSNQFAIDFVTIGNPGNSNDITGYGGVPYSYRIGKYTISQNQIDIASANGLNHVTAAAWVGDQPAANITWYEAAAFANWLNTSSGARPAYNLTFTNGAWSMALWSPSDAGYDASNPYRNSLAKYFLPSENEFYKAAYGKRDGSGYCLYTTASDIAPTTVISGTAENTAVYNQITPLPSLVYQAGGVSSYGTMAQGGNVWQWLETERDIWNPLLANNLPRGNRGVRGGNWYSPSSTLAAPINGVDSYYMSPDFEYNGLGFRIASRDDIGGASSINSARSVLINSNNTYVGYDGSGNSLVVTNGSLLQDVRGYIGTTTNSSNNTAVVTGTNSVWINSDNLYVGNDGSYNSLTVSAGGAVSNLAGYIGANFGASNTAVVAGVGSTWSNTFLAVGAYSSGNSLTVTNGGMVVTSQLDAGWQQSASGNSVLVSGTNSSIVINSSIPSDGIVIGSSGSGNSMTISNGARVVSSQSAGVGSMASASNNLVVVNGAGSSLSANADVTVGYFGDGNRMVISNGGIVSNLDGYIGTQSRSNSVVVTGYGSTWSNSGGLSVGNMRGDNSLVISNGGVVTTGLAKNSGASMGDDPRANGNSIKVTGSGSLLANEGFMTVGNAGSSNTLLIASGGMVTSSNSVIGSLMYSSDNSVVVSGSSQIGGTLPPLPHPPISIWPPISVLPGTNIWWGGPPIGTGTLVISTNSFTNTFTNGLILNTNSGSIYPTNISYGTLSVTSGSLMTSDQLTPGAIVTNGILTLNLSNSYTGSIISGTNVTTLPGIGIISIAPSYPFSTRSTWNAGSNLVVGDAGSRNHLSITDGGLVTSANGTIGIEAPSSNNSVLVTGVGSSWSNSGTVVVGVLGSSNSLVISNGGTAFAGGRLIISGSSGSNNSVIVTGANSSLTSMGDSFVGSIGSGSSLIISNGASVISGASGYGTIIGSINSSKNSVLVTGDGSYWKNSQLYIGGYSGSDSNNVLVSSGGRVESTYAAIGTGVASYNNLTISSGGTVATPYIIIGDQIFSSNNSLHLTDAGSRLVGVQGLIVGNEGLGNSMTISNGATVESSNGVIGNQASSAQNSVLVTASNSLWSNSASLTLGNYGSGTLTVANGANVYTTNLVIAAQVGSSATINYGRLGEYDTAGSINAETTSFGAGSWIANFNQTDLVEIGINVSGNGVLNQLGSGTTVLTGSNGAFAGPLNILNGTLSIGDGNTSGGSPSAGNVRNDSTFVLAPASSDAYSVPGIISGKGTVIHAGPGKTTLFATNTYTGPTLVNAGNLQVTGSLNTMGTVSVNRGGILSGTGSVGNVTVSTGATITPGVDKLPGTLSLQSALWAPGGNYNWVLNDASGALGTGYSSLNIASTLDLSQLSVTNKFNINVSAGTNGVPLNFNGLVSTNWTIASFGSITNFSASNFAINTVATNGASGWSGLTNGTLGISTNGNKLELTYTAKNSPPDWKTPTGKRYSAVIYAKVLDENGNPITAYGSKLAVFDGSDCAGVASPAGGQGGTKLYQLTVFANQSSVNGMTYQVYDSSSGVTSTLDETYDFKSGVKAGTINNPIVLHIVTKQMIPIYDGWTWISFHVQSADQSWASLLQRYEPSDNDVIIGTKGSVTYFGGEWYASSPDFKPEVGVMFMISSGKTTTIEAVGSKAPLPNLSLVSGWNWVGCPRSSSTTLLAMMPSMQSSNDDVIISQTSQMGTYWDGVWYNTTGDDFPIMPGMGYLIYVASPQIVPLR